MVPPFEARDMRDLEADMVGPGRTHSSRFDCQEAGTLKDTGRTVTRPHTNEKANVLRCSVCGREVYEWYNEEGFGDPDYLNSLEHWGPDKETVEYEQTFY